MIRAAVIASLAWLTIAATPALAEFVPPEVGAQFSDRMLFLDGTVLLPPGQWIVAATETRHVMEVEDSDIVSVVLIQPRDGQVAGVVLAQGNIVPLKTRPSLSSECWSDQAYFTAVLADDESGGACAAVLPIVTRQGEGGTQAWDQARAFASARQWRIPAAYMVASLRSADRNRLMDVRYAAAVPDDVVMSAAAYCAWAVPPDGKNGPIKRMAQDLTKFSAAMLPVAEIAGHTHLPELGTAPSLNGGGGSGPDPMLRLRLARIDQLAEDGAMSPHQADALSQRATEPVAGDPLIDELLWRSGYKTLTYKMATYIDTSTVYYLFVSDLPLALVSSAITNVLGMPIVYVNDFAWSYFGLKASKSKQPFTLASLGTACPIQ